MSGLCFCSSFGGFLEPYHDWSLCVFFSGVSVATCMAILHVGSAQQVRTGSASSKEDDYESDAATIVQKCVSQASGPVGALVDQTRERGQLHFPPWQRKGRGVLPTPLPLGSRRKRWPFSLCVWQVALQKACSVVVAVTLWKMSHSVSMRVWGLSMCQYTCSRDVW